MTAEGERRDPARDAVLRLYRAWAGEPPTDVEPVAADGSARLYLRLRGGGGSTVIAAYGPDRDENRAFLAFSRVFRGLGLPVPEIHAAEPEAGVWIEEDLGDTTLFRLLSGRREELGGGTGAAADDFPPSLVPLYRRVLELLPRFQVEGGRAVDFSVAYPRQVFDRRSISWDLDYFKYHFLKLAHVPFHEERLEGDFERLIGFLLDAEDPRYFLYRDFQSRNVMIRGGEPWFIDYQGGRRGALPYDPASLLYDAKADLPDALRDELLEGYLDALEEHADVDRGSFRRLYPGYVLVRLMQAMGAYGYRGLYEGKPHFLRSVPYAARNLRGLLARGLPLEVAELESVFGRIAERWAEASPDEVAEALGRGRDRPSAPAAAAPSDGSGAPEGDRLVVRVGSFSYRGGLPEDRAGHGGGFVFDCRALPNPGREEAYRDVTGLDAAVEEYFGARSEVEEFFRHVRALVDAQVERYLARGFTSLTVHFGCTGGQHRSGYLAERLTAHLRDRVPGGDVRAEHRERGAWPASAGSDAPAADREPPADEAGGAPAEAGPEGEEDAWRG